MDSLLKVVESKIADQQSQQNRDLSRALQNLQNQHQGDFNQTRDSIQQIVQTILVDHESKLKQEIGDLNQTIASLMMVNSSLNSMTLGVNQTLSEVSDDFKLIKKVSSVPPASCKYELTKETGQYLLKPVANEKAFLGYCEQDKFGGGWLVFQSRSNGFMNFYRNWTEYKNGFGQIDGEFWLGLERLHHLTKGKNHSLLVELEAYNGDSGYALYDGFEIGSEEEKYALKVLGSYNGTAGDSLTFPHEGQKFSTYDDDNDESPDGNCASYWKGAWWFRKCHTSLLNGEYTNEKGSGTNYWATFKEKDGIKLTKMMMREN